MPVQTPEQDIEAVLKELGPDFERFQFETPGGDHQSDVDTQTEFRFIDPSVQDPDPGESLRTVFREGFQEMRSMAFDEGTSSDGPSISSRRSCGGWRALRPSSPMDPASRRSC